jgi:hypothetical protein
MDFRLDCPRCRASHRSSTAFHATLVDTRYIVLECTQCHEQLMFHMGLPPDSVSDDVNYTLAAEA